MSRRPKPDYLDVEVSVKCSRGHLVGRAYKMAGGRHRYVVSNGATFRDHPSPEATSGKVYATCTRCGEEVQIKWVRVKDLLDQAELLQKHRGMSIAP